MGEILKAADCTYDNGEKNTYPQICKSIMFYCTPYILVLFTAVVKTTVLLADMNDFTDVNNIYKQCKFCLFTTYYSSCSDLSLGVSTTQRATTLRKSS